MQIVQVVTLETMGCCQASQNNQSEATISLISDTESSDEDVLAVQMIEIENYDGKIEENHQKIEEKVEKHEIKSKYKRKKNHSTIDHEVREEDVQKKIQLQEREQKQKEIEQKRAVQTRVTQQQIQEYESKNDAVLDKAIMTTFETQIIAGDTAQILDEQRSQLIGIDNNLHVIDENLNETEGILKSMTSFGGFLKRKLAKKKNVSEKGYVAPVPIKSAIERNIENTYNAAILLEKENVNPEDHKLNELLRGVKMLNQTATDINVELDEHNQIIESIDMKMDHVAPRIRKQIGVVNKYNKH